MFVKFVVLCAPAALVISAQTVLPPGWPAFWNYDRSIPAPGVAPSVGNSGFLIPRDHVIGQPVPPVTAIPTLPVQAPISAPVMDVTGAPLPPYNRFWPNLNPTNLIPGAAPLTHPYNDLLKWLTWSQEIQSGINKSPSAFIEAPHLTINRVSSYHDDHHGDDDAVKRQVDLQEHHNDRGGILIPLAEKF